MGAPTLPGALAYRYRVEETLGQGGMGIVYRALQKDLGRPVAIKLPTVTCVEDAARFVREGRILAGLEHPNIVRDYDAGTEDGQLYMLLGGRPCHLGSHLVALTLWKSATQILSLYQFRPDEFGVGALAVRRIIQPTGPIAGSSRTRIGSPRGDGGRRRHCIDCNTRAKNALEADLGQQLDLRLHRDDGDKELL